MIIRLWNTQSLPFYKLLIPWWSFVTLQIGTLDFIISWWTYSCWLNQMSAYSWCHCLSLGHFLVFSINISFHLFCGMSFMKPETSFCFFSAVTSPYLREHRRNGEQPRTAYHLVVDMKHLAPQIRKHSYNSTSLPLHWHLTVNISQITYLRNCPTIFFHFLFLYV